MSEHDDDIDFDFFGDSAPEPPKKRLVRRPSGPRPGGGPTAPKRPSGPPQGSTPIVRLVSLIAFAIAMILILIFAVRSCESSNKTAAYKSYMSSVATIAADSQTVGQNLSKLLDTQVLQEKLVETKLKGLIGQQTIDIQNASKLVPPGPLRQENAQMLEALHFRRSALSGLLNVFEKTASKRGSTAATDAGVALSDQMQRGVASDVIWVDMFAAPARDVLKREGIEGISPPTSVFVADTVRATVNSMGVVWQRLHGVQTSATTSGTVHGTNIAYVKVMPSGDTLTPDLTKTIKVPTNPDNLAFVVGVENGGDYLEQNIKVTLLIDQNPQPIRRVLPIGQIYNQTTKEVIFKGPFSLTDLINKIPVKVDVAPVTGETNTANNHYTYEVRFTL
ncbi:MAG: CARDB domain-containing protein [Gaiellaceae bacterium]|jgi:hypothetical protein